MFMTTLPTHVGNVIKSSLTLPFRNSSLFRNHRRTTPTA